MRRISYKPYFLLVLFFFGVMSLPKTASEKMRAWVVCSFAPTWKGFGVLKEKASYLAVFPDAGQSSSELERVQQENQLLRSQIDNVREWLLNEDRIQEQIERYRQIGQKNFSEASAKEFFKRRGQELTGALELQICALPAKVIFREPASWSSTLWIHLGEADNQKLNKKVIEKNSPVLLGTSIIGVVEFVGAKQSKVRLITDARLKPSVRACRGSEQNRHLLEHVEALLFGLERRDDVSDRGAVKEHLLKLKGTLLQQPNDFYLAKGELRGTSQPLWRSRSQVLKGQGFNYDFSDAEGPARDLRSGAPFDHSRKKDPVPLLRPGDLLITTGLDGVFPPGFRVATVSSVETLKEGASSYEIEAVSTAGNLDLLTHVFVLPAL